MSDSMFRGMAKALDNCPPPEEREARLKMVMAADALRQAAARIEALEARAEAAEARVARLEGALAWYRWNVSWCNNFGREGTEARDRLAKDLGKRAEAALSEDGGENG